MTSQRAAVPFGALCFLKFFTRGGGDGDAVVVTGNVIIISNAAERRTVGFFFGVALQLLVYLFAGVDSVL